MEIRENSFRYKLKKKLVPVLVVIVVAVLVWFAFGDKIPGLIPLLKEGDSQKIADYLSQETGVKGVIAVILLQAVQIASIVMPGMAIQVAAGIIYGWLEGFLMCYIGFVLSNLAVFLFARRMGSDRIRNVSMGKTSQWLMAKLRGTRPKFMVVIANMVRSCCHAWPDSLSSTDNGSTQCLQSYSSSLWSLLFCGRENGSLAGSVEHCGAPVQEA